MELVIAIPLFVVLLGGTMWVGDIILAKQKLAIADRYAAWSGGNRHRPAKGTIETDIQQIYYPAARVGDQRVQRVQYASQPLDYWSSLFGGLVSLEMKMPPWTRGWLNVGITWDPPASVPDETEAFAGGGAGERPSWNEVIMRTEHGTRAHRTWKPAELFHNRVWERDVYRHPWAYELSGYAEKSADALAQVPALPNPVPEDEYERFGQYVQWSD